MRKPTSGLAQPRRRMELDRGVRDLEVWELEDTGRCF